MSDARKPKMREAAEDAPLPKLDVESQPKRAPDRPLSPEQSYLQRKAEVAQQDHEVFSEYLQEKIAREQQQKVQLAEPPPKAPTKVNRRSLLTWAAGTAVVGEAVTLGYPMVTGQSIPAQGLQHGGGTYTEAQRHPIDREFVNPKADVGGRNFGSWVLLMPTKLGGGTYAVNLETGRALAWISYWNYGDYNPISHHLCAFPSADPAKGFEWINSTQGGKNALIYGIPTNIETPGEGFNIYRVRFDGAQMELMENVAETTGLGLGVHVTIDPKTAERYFVTDGQKDIAACFDRLALRQRARMLGRLLASVGPLALAVVGGGAFAKYAMFARLPEVPVSLEDAALATSTQVQEIVRYIEQSNPQLFNNLLGLLARDTTTIAALGASIAALTMHTLANRREPRPPVIKPQVSTD